MACQVLFVDSWLKPCQCSARERCTILQNKYHRSSWFHVKTLNVSDGVLAGRKTFVSQKCTRPILSYSKPCSVMVYLRTIIPHIIEEQFCIGLRCLGSIPWKLLSKKPFSIGNLWRNLLMVPMWKASSQEQVGVPWSSAKTDWKHGRNCWWTQNEICKFLWNIQQKTNFTTVTFKSTEFSTQLVVYFPNVVVSYARVIHQLFNFVARPCHSYQNTHFHCFPSSGMVMSHFVL